MEQDRPPFFMLGNEILDVFQPIMGPHCFTIYSLLARRAFKNPELKHSLRELAGATKLGASTVSRSLEIMVQLGLVKLVRRGGSQDSECELLNSWEAAKRLEATYEKKSLSCALPREVRLRLEKEVKEIRARQQGKKAQNVRSGALRTCENPSLRVSQRDASVSLVRRQRSTRETQTGTHLLLEKRRIEKVPSPTPSHERTMQSPKDFPNEREPALLLKWATDRFNGVIDNMRAHLLDTGKPLNAHLANGYAEWQQFGFGSLAVEAAAMGGNVLTLVLSASDAAAAREGLKKCHRVWDAGIREWFGDDVEVKLEMAAGKQSEYPAQKDGVTDGNRIEERQQGNQLAP
jgi:hypothetical protein